MKKYEIRKLIMALSFILCMLIIEVTTFATLNMGILPKYWWLDVGFYFILAIIFYFSPYILQNILSLTFILLNLILNYVIICVYASSGRIFDWSMMLLLNETRVAISMAVYPILPLIIMLVAFIGYIVLWSFNTKFIKTSYKEFIKKLSNLFALIGLSVVVTIVGITPIQILKKSSKESYFTSDGFMFASFASAYSSFNKFGCFGFYGIDLIRRIFPKLAPEIDFDLDDLVYDNYASILNNKCNGDNILLIIGESMEDYVISKELTPVLYSLKNGIDLKTCGINNFYNVTTTTSGERELTRKDYSYSNGTYLYNGINIYNGLTEGEVGLDLKNFKSYESTNYSEHKIITGNGITEKYSLPWILNYNGYTSSYMHCNYEYFYDRDIMINDVYKFNQSLFYEDMSSFLPITDDLTMLTLDSVAVNHYLSNPNEFNLFPEGKFFSTFLSVTTHGEHTDICEPELIKPYYEFLDSVTSRDVEDEKINIYKSISDIKLKQAVRTFMAKTLDTEITIALMVDELYKQNRLENTIICFLSDHFCYSSDVVEYKKLFYSKTNNNNNCYDMDLYNAPCFIYSSKIKNSELLEYGYSRQIHHITSAYDIAPTLLSLCGIKYNQAAYLGYCVINASLTTGEQVESDLYYSDTLKFYMNDLWMSYDGYSYNSKVEINKLEKELFRYQINKFEMQRYYIKNKL